MNNEFYDDSELNKKNKLSWLYFSQEEMYSSLQINHPYQISSSKEQKPKELLKDINSHIKLISSKIKSEIHDIEGFKKLYYKYEEENNILCYYVLFESEKELKKNKFDKVIEITSDLDLEIGRKYNFDVDILPVGTGEINVNKLAEKCNEFSD